jgi:hypothetical protein
MVPFARWFLGRRSLALLLEIVGFGGCMSMVESIERKLTCRGVFVTAVEPAVENASLLSPGPFFRDHALYGHTPLVRKQAIAALASMVSNGSFALRLTILLTFVHSAIFLRIQIFLEHTSELANLLEALLRSRRVLDGI